MRTNEIAISGPRLAQFARFVENELAERGALHITKASGLFAAIKGQA
jgi:hypothetical protein